MEDRISAKEHRQKLRRRLGILQRCLSVFLLGCIAYLIWYRLDSLEEARKNQRLWEIAWEMEKGRKAVYDEAPQEQAADKAAAGAVQTAGGHAQEQTAGGEAAASAEAARNAEAEQAGKETRNMAGFEALLQINGDLKAWISIPGTVLSLPVVQGSDNSYYLNHDFYGEQDRHGTIFIDCDADLYAGGPNTVIYGHHMRDGSMFGILKEYRREEFYKEHPSFFLTLPDGEREYEILAVLRNNIIEGNGEAFQYYDYKQITDGAVFAEYCRKIRELAVYDTGVEAAAGDELVTLCTCDYGSRDQRLLVVGKRVFE